MKYYPFIMYPMYNDNCSPSGIAVGGRAAGAILAASPSPRQPVQIREKLPDAPIHPYGVDPLGVALNTYTEVYEYRELRVGSVGYIPYWKVLGGVR